MRTEPCPLCGDASVPYPPTDRAFWHSPRCDLVFRDPSARLSADAELARYREHRNSIDDPGYITFLSRLADPLTERLASGAHGLDFGCGPVRAMEHIMTRRGFSMRSWDPFFFPDVAPLALRYDFVTCSEVAEHLADPAAGFARLASLLEPAGTLAVMTQPRVPDGQFATWYYQRDPTHLAFYSANTMQWIAKRHGWTLQTFPRGVTIFSS